MAKQKRRTPRQTRKAQQQHASALFDRQIDSLWSGFGIQCREFAAGYNHESGARELDVYCQPDIIVVRFAEGAELGLRLDRVQRAVSGWIASGCAVGSCSFESPPLGLAIHDGRLRFVYAAREISEEDLAVRLLTGLVGASEAAIEPSRG
jgi:hypothetical protein